MVSASIESEMLDYTEEELEEILKDVENFEREELGESDIEGLMKTWKWIAIEEMSPSHHFKQHGSWPPMPQLSLSSLLAQIITCQTQPNHWIIFFVPPTNVL